MLIYLNSNNENTHYNFCVKLSTTIEASTCKMYICIFQIPNAKFLNHQSTIIFAFEYYND